MDTICSSNIHNFQLILLSGQHRQHSCITYLGIIWPSLLEILREKNIEHQSEHVQKLVEKTKSNNFELLELIHQKYAHPLDGIVII
jgi:hypothetical protein